MKAWRPILVVTVLLLWGVFSGQAGAENREGAFSVTPMVGGHTFEGDQNLEDDPTYGLALGYNLSSEWAVEGIVNFTDSGDKRHGTGDVEVYAFRLEALYHLLPEKDLVPFFALGVGGITYDGDGENEDDFLADYGLGLKWFFRENLALRGDVRHLYAFDDPDHNLLYTAGLTWQIGGAEPPVPVREEQPPAVAAPRDSDRDGVADDRDRCPDTPGGVQVDERGCPRDRDADGVPDYLDKCPDTRKGEFVDEEGCTIKLTLHINFDFDKAEIKPEFVPDLERAARFIKKYEKVPKILLEGHTDSIGEESYNKDLSMRRARAVRQYLIENFSIDPERLVGRGVGESQPIASNETDEGRYQNRRVEIICCLVIPPEQ